MKVYITKSNAKRILRKISLSDIGEIEGNVYKKPIYFLSKVEKKYLLLMQYLLKEPEKFAIEVYKPVVNKDTYKYVYESEQPPSYHYNKNCERLAAKFKNFEVPFEIKTRVREKAEKEGKSETQIEILEKKQVEIFRAWFKNNLVLFRKNTEKFLEQLDIRWNVQRNVSEVERDNSGVEVKENLNLGQLEKEIDEIISAAGRFFHQNKDKQQIIKRFQKLTFLAKKKEDIYGNDTELSDAELKEFLLKYDKQFKKPIKDLLIEYYRVKYNADLTFKGNLLERLNFRTCSACKHTENPEYVIDSTITKQYKEEEIIS